MAKDYTKTANTALRLIKKSGRPCQLIRNESTVDPAKQWEVAAVVKSYDDCFAVKFPASQRDVAFLPDGTSISTTAKILIDAVNLDNQPTIGDEFQHNGDVFQIIAVKPLQPASVDVVWTVYVKA